MFYALSQIIGGLLYIVIAVVYMICKSLEYLIRKATR